MRALQRLVSFTTATLVPPTQRARVTAIELMKAPHTPLLIVELLMHRMTRRALVGVKELRMWLSMARMATQTATGPKGVAMESVVAQMIIGATIGAKVSITGSMTVHMTIQVMAGVKGARLEVSITLVTNGVEMTIPAMLGVKQAKDGNINSLGSNAAAVEEDEDNYNPGDDVSTPTLVEPKNWHVLSSLVDHTDSYWTLWSSKGNKTGVRHCLTSISARLLLYELDTAAF
jgi:hypothetical protein